MQIRTPPRILQCIIRGNSIAVSKVDLAITTIATRSFSISIVPRATRIAALKDGGRKSVIGLRASVVKGCIRGLLRPRRRGGRDRVAQRFLRGYKFWGAVSVGERGVAKKVGGKEVYGH